MASAKRPSLRKHDRVTLAPHKSVIPPYDGKPFVLRDTVLTVSHLTGTGSNRNPWHVVVTDGNHFWHLEPDDVVRAEESHSTMRRSPHNELNTWLDRQGYHHAHARKVKSPTGRAEYASKERDHHITTHGRQSLSAWEFALPPSSEEKRRSIKGRLPIDTIGRARSALARASMMHHQGHLSAGQLTAVRRKIHTMWPSIEIHTTHSTRKQALYVVTMPPTDEMGSYKTRARGSTIAEARSDALVDYNLARRHDGLPPVDHLPRGTKVTKES